MELLITDEIDSDEEIQNLSKSETKQKPQPQQSEKKKTEEQPNNQDKIDAIFEMLPLIKEAYNICQFMLENR
jgi:hypothetical protein